MSNTIVFIFDPDFDTETLHQNAVRPSSPMCGLPYIVTLTASWLPCTLADGTSRSVIADLAREALCAIRLVLQRPLASSPHLAVGKITMGHTLKAGRAIGVTYTKVRSG